MLPIVLNLRAWPPTAVLKEPVVFAVSALKPKAELYVPVVTLVSAFSPSAVLKPSTAISGVGVCPCAVGEGANQMSISEMKSSVVVLIIRDLI